MDDHLCMVNAWREYIYVILISLLITYYYIINIITYCVGFF
ncbi:Uncharacterised protein [Yersinia aleksiciae]|uniref:Uncharacterized protein n=1 Tax=Yersinia aleksiciae TaxID=263819 RepID=A0A0T9TPS3_YERAE|nr:Uncharacterised protein [Yersinia aleksiciae]CNK95074.1 Uncharacterised protein [Yersinia aleksiciae]